MTERWLVMPRGINVGAGNRVPMAQLRSRLTSEGYRDVATVLQSGNVIVSAESDSRAEVVGALRRLLKDEFDVDVACLARTGHEVRGAIERDPLAGLVSNPSRYLVHFPSREAASEAMESLMQEDHSPRPSSLTAAWSSI